MLPPPKSIMKLGRKLSGRGRWLRLVKEPKGTLHNQDFEGAVHREEPCLHPIPTQL